MAILSFYGPTNMHQLPYLSSGRLSDLVLPPCTTELLKAATDFDNPPTEIDIPLRVEDYTRPRGVMGLAVFRESIITEFILRGFIEGPDGSLELPAQGCVAAEEIDGISMISLSEALFSKLHTFIFHQLTRDSRSPVTLQENSVSPNLPSHGQQG